MHTGCACVRFFVCTQEWNCQIARRCFLGLWRSAAQWACDSPSVPAAAGVPASAFCAWGVGTRALRSALFPRYQPPPGCQVVRRRSAWEGPSDRRGRRGAGGSGGLRPAGVAPEGSCDFAHFYVTLVEGGTSDSENTVTSVQEALRPTGSDSWTC